MAELDLKTLHNRFDAPALTSTTGGTTSEPMEPFQDADPLPNKRLIKTNGSHLQQNGTKTSSKIYGTSNGNSLLPNRAKPSPTSLPQRKPSSPMMPAFMVSAPGKTIVYGEHAVVHGKGAIAAAISLRSYLLVTALSKSRRTVTLVFRDIKLDHTWNIDDLPWSEFSNPSKKKFYYDLVTSLDPDLVSSLQPHINTVSPNAAPEVRKVHRSAASAFLYLFLSLGSQQSSPPCVYTLRSTLPIGAGLGSSASISVCLATALLIQIRALSGPHPDQPVVEADTQIERINRWAFVGELNIHGNPSGVDNTVSSAGKAVLFQRHDYTKPPFVEFLKSFPELPLFLINTRQPRSTATEVAKVAVMKKAQPAVTDSILNSIDQVTKSAYTIINTPSLSDQSRSTTISALGDLFRINHGLLVSLGVSHPRLERIRELIDHAGIGWTKLTGAGGGGCAISLLKPDIDPESAKALEEQLEKENFEIYETTLAGDGVGVLWPAVLKNGTDEEGGEEIDEGKFLEAEGNDGIEQLVGVGAGLEEGKREGWKFWG